MNLFGIRLVGINAANGHKLLLTLAFLAALALLTAALRSASAALLAGERWRRAGFWTRQGINLFSAVAVVFGLASIWFDDPTRLTTAVGLISAGLAFALQKVVTSLAGYFVILRGDNFTVGDRITMGGVRGDVVALGFIQTTIMEMGQPPPVQGADPAMWVKSRQFTGRIVTVANSRIFDEPIYNYTRDFPFIWEEMTLPVSYRDDRARAEAILLQAAQKHAVKEEALPADMRDHLRRRFGVSFDDVRPKVYWRLTDNWLELTVRFLVHEHGIRDVKNTMAREVLAGLDAAQIGIASATFEVVGLPPLRLAPDDGRA